jgi:putative PIN family toxin of toxin-antitoxin system
VIVVLGTNVLVSALLSPFGPPGQILDLILAGDIRLAYDDRILAEYRQVLARPRFRFDQQAVADLLDYLVATGEPVSTQPLTASLPDPYDLPFLEAAATLLSRGGAFSGTLLIASNLRHFPADTCGDVQVLAPATFLARWQTSQAAE